MIKVTALKKSYGEVAAVRDVSFSIEAGEIVALLGGNGSGKSTTINILTGLLRADAGTVSIDGIDPFSQPLAARKKIGVFPDKTGLFNLLTVREHLAFFGALQGLKGKALTKAVEHTLLLLDLTDIAERLSKGFSHGQSVKLALARAMVHSPQFLILDEPSRGLDVFAVRQFRDVVLRLRDSGTGILFSSHVMQEVELLADRVAVIADGRVHSEGSPAELINATGTTNLEEAFMVTVGKQ
ncbi:MAG: sodium transport system ATP-binding protein [Paraglaciecola psychrophila]|jgi:sodium transport system ATP-binding protein